MQHRLGMVTAAIVVGALSLGIQAQNSSSRTPAQGQPTDDGFVQFAAMSDMAEIQLGQLAQQRAMSSDVKQFGARMVTDHTKSSQMLRQVAGSAAASLPTTLDSRHQQVMQRLQQLSGAEFDREYMRMMVDDHRQAVERFSMAAGLGSVARNGTGSGGAAASGPGVQGTGPGVGVSSLVGSATFPDPSGTRSTAGDIARGNSPAGTLAEPSRINGSLQGTGGSGSGGATGTTGGSAASAPQNVQQFAAQVLPTLQEHLMMAEQIRSRLE